MCIRDRSFTRDDLANNIIDKDSEFGVVARGIIEDENTTGSEFSNLYTNNVNVKSHAGVANSLHHKYLITYANVASSDPTLLTGSHNWSNNAENNSDENTLIIHDHTTANIYLQEFTKRFNELSTTSFINNLIDININVFPNPSVGEINIESDLEINKIHVYQMDGKLIKIVTTQNFNLERNAIYYLKVFTNSGNAVKTIVVQ